MANNLNGKLKVSNIDCCFNIGSTVLCKTCHKKDIEGEVLAFDSSTKILILKSAAKDGSPGTQLSDINFVNLNFVSDVEVVKEVTNPPPTPHSLSINMLKNRFKNNVDSKKRLITSLQAGVSPEGQKLYLTISKTISEIKWDGPDILVYDNVRITPPYKPENVVGIGNNNKATAHIKKIVEKYIEDAQSVKKELQTTSTTTTNNISVTSSSNGNGNHSNCAATVPQ